MRVWRACIFVVLFMIQPGCKNRILNEGEEFKPKEIHESVKFQFDRIEGDGLEYLILERDNNNPHEGFGFMAFRANQLMEKQDSILAHLKTIEDFQSRIYARLFAISLEDATALRSELFNQYLKEEQEDLLELEKTEYEGETGTQDKDLKN